MARGQRLRALGLWACGGHGG